MKKPAVLMIVGVATVAMTTVVLWPRPDQSQDELTVGTVDEVVAEHVMYLKEPGLFVVATESGFLALSDDSRHLGDRVLYCPSSRTFSSPDHGESFDGLGRYLGGPASGDMGRYQTQVIGDQVVDLTTLELADRSTTSNAPLGSQCQGAEDRPGFFDG